MNYKPFDLEAAKKGAKVITKDGRQVRILCFDAKLINEKATIVALVERSFSNNEQSVVRLYDETGRNIFGNPEDLLVMAPVVVYANLYTNGRGHYFVGSCYETLGLAKQEILSDYVRKVYVKTIEIEP